MEFVKENREKAQNKKILLNIRKISLPGFFVYFSFSFGDSRKAVRDGLVGLIECWDRGQRTESVPDGEERSQKCVVHYCRRCRCCCYMFSTFFFPDFIKKNDKL